VGRIICTQESDQQSERRVVIFDEAPQQFHEHLSSFLQGEKYQNAVPNLQGEDLARLVDDPQEQAWHRLITRAAPHDELPSLIETILSGSTTDVVDRLSETDAQVFIDVMDEVHHHAHYF